MVKVVGCLLLFGTMMRYSNLSENFFPFALTSFAVFFILPAGLTKLAELAKHLRAPKVAVDGDIARANAEEFEHSTGLRRELERNRALSDQRVAELAAILDLQATMDDRKEAKLAAAREDASKRREADVATLLERLKAMRAGGGK